MSQSIMRPMDAVGPHSLFLRSTSEVSLHERFSQVLLDQLTRSRSVRVQAILLQRRRRRRCRTSPGDLLTKGVVSRPPGEQTRDPSVGVTQQPLTSGSVWTRLGCRERPRRHVPFTQRGFWSFLHKYRWRAGSAHTCRRTCDLRAALSRRRFLMRRDAQRLPAGQTQPSLCPQMSGATTSRGCGLRKDIVPTKKQLDAQLDEYMSVTRSRLDKDLDDYMSMSRRRLDAELDEYMMMAGQTQLD